ncbi:MAG: ethanolamine utilization protein EutH [Clostridia bacterium]|nr:ethanolamine utilization protein EutH [Clostridia bacterium]
MQRIIMLVMAVGAALGGLDRLIGDRFGLGRKFEEGFTLLGPTALSMAGILCLTPVLSNWLGALIMPVYRALGLDPALFAGILAIDMGGYPMAMSLAEDPALGRYAGIVVAAILGCTLTFTIPVGMGMLAERERDGFAQGTLYGLAVMPPALLLGAALCGLPLPGAIRQLVPVIALSLLLIAGIRFAPAGAVKAFRGFAAFLRALITVGLILGAVQYMTGFAILPGLLPIEEAMAVVSSIGVVLLGSLPTAELFTRLLKRPLEALGARLGLNGASMAGFLLACISVMPMLALMKDMDRRGRIANAAAAVCSTAALSAHLGFTVSQEPALLMPLLAAKLIGGALGAAVALLATRRDKAV